MRHYVEAFEHRTEEGRRRPADSWTLAEVLDHLAVMEEGYAHRLRQFFRANEIAGMLTQGLRSFAPPPAAASARRFSLLRARILSRLRRVRRGDRSRRLSLRAGGVLTLGKQLAAIVAHDREHRRQIEALLRR